MKKIFLLSVLLACFLFSQAQIKISALPAVSGTNMDSVLLPVVQSGITKKAPGYLFKNGGASRAVYAGQGLFAVNDSTLEVMDSLMTAIADNTAQGLANAANITAKQNTLISGSNIKTVNSSSILGSGDISVGTVTNITSGFGITGGPISSFGEFAIDSASVALKQFIARHGKDSANLSVKTSGAGLATWLNGPTDLFMRSLTQGYGIIQSIQPDSSIKTILDTTTVFPALRSSIPPSSGGGTWGTITGSLPSQSDLYDSLSNRIKQGGNSYGADVVIGTNDNDGTNSRKLIIRLNGAEKARFYTVVGSNVPIFSFNTTGAPNLGTTRINISGGLEASSPILTGSYLGIGTDASNSPRFSNGVNSRPGAYFESGRAVFHTNLSNTETAFTFTNGSANAKTWSTGTYLYNFPLAFNGSTVSSISVAEGIMINPTINISGNGLDEYIIARIKPTLTNLTSGAKTAVVTALKIDDGLLKTRSLLLTNAGDKLSIATGTNASNGTATLSSGTVTINTTAVTASSILWVQYNGAPSTITSILTVPTITAGTSFIITALTPGTVTTATTDNNTVQWWIIN